MQTPFKPKLTISDEAPTLGENDIRALTPEQLAEDARIKQEFLDNEYKIICRRVAAEQAEAKEKKAKGEAKKQKQEERDAKQTAERTGKEQWHREIADRKSRERILVAKRLSGELSAHLLALSPYELSLCPTIIRSIKADLELALESL